ncbi:MAG: ABC-F family ATP-binding cassette domain-containing protein [Rickettsiales bacterium]
MISFKNVSVSINGRVILNDINFQITNKQRVGLIGRNGSGKSTIFKTIENILQNDSGVIDKAQNWKILSIKQEMPDKELTPIEYLLAQDQVRHNLFEELNNCTDMDKISEIYEKLESIDAYSAESRAAKILKGLGFDEDAQNKKLGNFSGGFRMRVALAAAIFQEPDLLLLDEPTNHLDFETTEWLENFLKKYQKSFILISHERDFLNNTIDNVLHLKNGKIEKYKGNFDTFVELSTLRQKNIEEYNAKIAAKKAHMLEFIKRFGAKASKASQAQSRMKMIEKMNFVPIDASDNSIAFNFPESTKCSYPMLEFSKVTLKYGDNVILHNISGVLGLNERIALVGKNGNGKTTFAKFLAGELQQSKGTYKTDSKFKVAFYKQDQLEQLDISKTLINHMYELLPNGTEQNIRSHLARFGFGPEYINQKIGELSGGERARLLFASLTIPKPNLLILDEPTNHLDIEMRESLMSALNNYDGSVILITHDKYLLRGVVDQIWIIKNKGIEKFDGNIYDYKF